MGQNAHKARTHTHTHIFHHQCISSPPHVGQSAQAHALSFWLCHSRSVAAHTCAATVLHVRVRSLCGRFCVVVAVMVCFYLCCASAYTHGHYASLFRAVCNSIRLAGGVLAENKPSDRLWPHRADCRCRRSSFTYMFRTYMFRNRAPKKKAAAAELRREFRIMFTFMLSNNTKRVHRRRMCDCE